MKTKLIISLGVLLFPLLTIAQVAPHLYIVKSNFSTKETITKNLITDPLSIANMQILSPQDAENRFGKLAENTLVLLMTPKPGVKFSTVGEFFKHHHIKGNQRNLPFVIDGEVRDTTNLLIEENCLKVLHIRDDSIEIVTGGHLHYLDLKRRGLYHN
ncbi:MAG: hypothetical protein H7289_16250 [Mucilaginibacter sp.]|nr:hypothetical protein [Mucilaginibacter sp.]